MITKFSVYFEDIQKKRICDISCVDELKSLIIDLNSVNKRKHENELTTVIEITGIKKLES